MKISLFFEMQLPRPWDDGAEHRLVQETLEQVELADRLGYHCVWFVEHHHMEEYAHSSAPEILLANIAARTSRIRLGHGIVSMPPAVNHPARVAERASMLDLVSDGRVELGTGESSSEAELGGFRIDPADKRGMWEESLRVAVRCMTEAPFTGFAGQFVTMPPRNVVPKPLQRPHPPLWVACSRRDTILLAARRGLGALSFSFADPEEARGWVDEYYALLDSECVPVGDAVNANVSCTTLFMCAPTPEEAIRRGVENANFFGYSSAHYYVFGTHEPGTTDIWREFESGASERGFSTEAVIAEAQRTERLFAKAAGASGGLRGAIGSPDQIREYCERYEEMGVDQLAFIAQAGRSCHEDIMESIELFGTQVLPEIHARDVDLEAAKRDRLAPVIARALARKGADDHPPLPVPDYSFDAIPLAVATGSAGSDEYVTWLRDMQARRRRGEAVSIPDAAFSGVDVVPELDRLSSDRGDG